MADPRGSARAHEAEEVLSTLRSVAETLQQAKIDAAGLVLGLQRVQQVVLRLMREREELQQQVALLSQRVREPRGSGELELLGHIARLEEQCTKQRQAFESRLGALLKRESALQRDLEELEARSTASPCTASPWPGDDPLGLHDDARAREREVARLHCRVAALEAQLADALSIFLRAPAPDSPAPPSHNGQLAVPQPVVRARSAPPSPCIGPCSSPEDAHGGPGRLSDTQSVGVTPPSAGRIPRWAEALGAGGSSEGGQGSEGRRGRMALLQEALKRSGSSSRSLGSRSPRRFTPSAPTSPRPPSDVSDVYRIVRAEQHGAKALPAPPPAGDFEEIRGALRKRWQRH